ncbi:MULTISPECIES: tRNA (N6-isopentenyl adenosine(37)-C2)-methylthiotransferase MiaB [unclassified Siphonobacter]|uniref:tRNA (N6-isopentenyl adenosine(37)-C2)-methylthiotransferase MiaB n=1 Tax=unclassified Siphonobacter TaxID=2635712 RepID=UPI00278B1C37|nr:MULTISPECIES: tRNA (N6-isopentenyl adenosine(37)-C2)-methylthiotransferase MiaB [unclassified Siphonobacter]MDQ1088531.1 tRNA-2-methylthio-N6-dimethylallyladenosine synthase [Siphonobacter sp. SORGH_AS_1065]MDR6194678.1 tRNA-2-methylthio-N6-dimethylallyladenosine synthase [Siphonobacter sp. SORGH_AS_0500]
MKTLEILTPEDKQGIDLPRLLEDEQGAQGKKKLYIESYGCQMNFSDSEIVASIMREKGFATTSSPDDADLVLLNTCAIRDNAEQKVRNRLSTFVSLKRRKPDTTIGVLGCMAERLKAKLLEEEKIVDMVVGPDAYRDLPRLLEEVETGQKAVNVFLSKEETYADIAPVRLNTNGVTAFISIMRGCDNMCSFCVVPFTRGRERSRDAHSIVKEAEELFNQGYREVTLLGQNVDSYKWTSEDGTEHVNFAHLLEKVALVHPDLRVRFSTSHPKDITDEVLYTMKKYDNVCNYIHLPAQSGNSRVLKIMNRTYDREWYMNRVDAIRRILGEDCGISQDMIAGFCTETEEEHRDTLTLMEYVKYDYGYMFAYSERPGTPAAKKFVDDIPEEVKKRRLNEIIALQQQHSMERNQMAIGKVHRVLVEGTSKRSTEHLQGRNDQNKVVVFPKHHFEKGQYVNVLVTDCTAATLLGEPVLSED